MATESLNIDNSENPFGDTYPDLVLPAGSLSLEDEQCLLQYSKDVDTVVDVGTFKGRSAAIVSLNANNVISFDVWNAKTEEVARKNLESFTNVKVITGNGCKHYAVEGKLGLLFIDVQHDYKPTIGVFNSWFDRLEVGAHIIFHDFSSLYPGVIRAFNEVRAKKDVEFIVHTGWCGVFRKTV